MANKYDYKAAYERQGEIIEKHKKNGVIILAPATVYIAPDVKIGTGSVIYPNNSIEGNSAIGENCIIGPNNRIENTSIGDESEIEYTVAIDSKIGKNTTVGPFAYIRPNSVIGDNIKIGDFVEIKNSNIDNGTKVSHLAYIGDSDVGKNVNFGCGSITVNYDGKNKNRTTVRDNSFVGCNSNLIAPVTIEKGGYVAAGSTITDDIPENALAIARKRQVIKENWTKPKDR